MAQCLQHLKHKSTLLEAVAKLIRTDHGESLTCQIFCSNFSVEADFVVAVNVRVALITWAFLALANKSPTCTVLW